MGQASTKSSALLHQSFQLFRQTLQEAAFQKFKQFLNNQLSDQDTKSIRQFLRREINQNFLNVNLYLKWLYNQASKQQVPFDNLETVWEMVKQIETQQFQLESVFKPLEGQRRKRLHAKYFDKAAQLGKIGQYQKAILQLKQLHHYLPDEAQTLANVAILYENLSNFQQSLLFLQRAISINREERYLVAICELYEKMEDVSEANEQYINQILTLNPTSFQYKQLKANFLLKAKRWNQATLLYSELIRKPAGKVNLIDKFNQSIKKSANHEQALSLYLYLIQLYPQQSAHYLNVGVSNDSLNKRDEAIRYFKKGLSLKENALAYQFLGNVYRQEHMQEEMLDAYQKSIKMNNKKPVIYERIADYFSKNEHYLAEALQFYQLQVQQDSQNVQAYFDIGRQQYNKGDILKSIQYYKRAVQLEPDNYQSYLLLASSKSRVKLHDEAVCNLEIAIALQPDNLEAYNLLGNAYFGMGKLSKAISNYQKSIDIDPKEEVPYFNLGLLYFNECQFDYSQKYLKECIKINPSYSQAYYLLSFIYLKRNQAQKGIQYLESIIRDNPTNPESFSQLASAYFEIYNYQKSLQNFKIAHRLNEKETSFIYNTGIVLVLSGRPAEGLEWIHKAIARKKDNVYLCGQAIAFVKLKRYEQAISSLYNTIIRDPQYYQPYFHLGKAIKLSGKQAEEYQAYTQLLQAQPKTTIALECKAFFSNGIGDVAAFFDYFNQALQLLKEKLVEDERQGRKQICKFMRQFVRHLGCVIRDYEQLDLVIMLGVLNRDIGDFHQTEWCFNRILNHISLQAEATQEEDNLFIISLYQTVSTNIHKSLLVLYQKELANIKNVSPDYFFFLLQFVLQQLFQRSQKQGLLFYKTIHNDPLIQSDPSISNLFHRVRDQKMQELRIIVQGNELPFQVLKKGEQLVKRQINVNALAKDIAKQMIGRTINENLSLIKQSFPQIEMIAYQSSQNEVLESFLESLKVGKWRASSSVISSLEAKSAIDDLRQKDIQTACQQLWRIKLPFQIANFLSIQLFNYMSLEAELLEKFKAFLSSIVREELFIQNIFTELDFIVRKFSRVQFTYQSNFLQDRNIYTVNLESSVIYQDYDYEKSNASLKSVSSFEKSVESKLSAETIQPKRNVNKKSIMELSGISPYSHDNLFQRELVKFKDAGSSIKSDERTIQSQEHSKNINGNSTQIFP